MFLRKRICRSTGNCLEKSFDANTRNGAEQEKRCGNEHGFVNYERQELCQLCRQTERLKTELDTAETVIIGAGAGMSASAGFDYGGERFYRYFSDFSIKYGITDMYSGGFYPFGTPEEYWAWWSRQVYVNRYDIEAGKPYIKLLELLKGKDCFIVTTNVDHQFQKAGFDKKRLFYTQGDYGLWQCSKPCCNRTWDNEAVIRQMVKKQKNMRIPSGLVPKCPLCGAPMSMNLRCDDSFVQDEGWYQALERYESFIGRNKGGHVLFLELGVGMNTPGIIKFPFWEMTAENKNAVYACVNSGEAIVPPAIKNRSICIDGDIGDILEAL